MTETPTPSMLDIMWTHYERTLRDEFAKALVQAIITSGATTKESPAILAYKLADLMLLARSAKNS